MEIIKNLYLYLVVSFLSFILGIVFLRFLIIKNIRYTSQILENKRRSLGIINIKNKTNNENKKNQNKGENKNDNNNQSKNVGNRTGNSEENKDNKEEEKVKKINQIVKDLGEELAVSIIDIIYTLIRYNKVDILLAENLAELKGRKEENRVGILLKLIRKIREEVASTLGVIIPGILIKSDSNLKPNTYVIRVDGIEVSKGEIHSKFFAVGPEDLVNKLNGKVSTEPLYGLHGVWIEETQKEHAEKLGCFILDDTSFIANHLQKIIQDKITEIFDATSYYAALAAFEKTYFQHEFLKTSIPYKVLKNLLSDGVSIRQIRDIFSAIIVGSNYTKDPEKLTEYVRINIPHIISESFAAPDKIIYAAKLDPEIEDKILRKLENSEKDYVRICSDYDITSAVFSEIRDKFDYYINYFQSLYEIANSNIIFKIENSIINYLDYCLKKNIKPVIVTSLKVRRAFREILKIRFKNINIFVISNFEIHPDYQVKFVSNIASLI